MKTGMNTIVRFFTLVTCIWMLQGCIYKVVTVPVKIAYKTTKGVVKGTAAVVGAVIPDSDDEEHKSEKQKD